MYIKNYKKNLSLKAKRSKAKMWTCVIITIVQDVQGVGCGVVPASCETAVLCGAPVAHPRKGRH
jgi:hypothetical protein